MTEKTITQIETPIETTPQGEFKGDVFPIEEEK